MSENPNGAKTNTEEHGLKQHDIGVSTVVFMIFCLVAAGCYGIEEMIPAAGPGLTIILLIVLPFIWGLPFGLVASELGSIRPQEGGYYKWVQEALGEFWGFQAGWWRTISIYIDNTLYVILAGGYAATAWNLSRPVEFVLKLAMILIFTYINIRGVRDVGIVSTILSILVIVAFAMVAICGFMGSYYHVSAAFVGWVITAYMLTAATLSVPFGKIADTTGRRRILIIGILLFSLSGVVSVFAPVMQMMIVCRVLQGTAGAMIFATNTAILISAFPASQRGKVLGKLVASTYVGLSAGPVIGGLLNYSFGWKSIFIVSAAVSMFSFIVAVTRLPKGEKLIHAIKVAMDEAEKCKQTGEEKTIVFGLTGTGYFDMVAYQKYNDGEMTDYIPTDEDLRPGFESLPKIG